ncbi:MAG TPA: hypothetical protein VM600_04190, partial [Actinomycetota bacterium]|nr:hypothetical protein [Actinomycetota bacterium]
MRLRGRLGRIAIVSVLLVGVAGVPLARAGDDFSSTGRWLAPFSEDADGDGVGDFDARPPASRAESARLPAGVNAVALPDGRVLYWSQLDGTESVQSSIGFEQPANPRSRTRMLELDRPSGDAPTAAGFSTPSPEHGAAGDLVGTHQVILSDGRVLVAGGTAWSNEDAALGSPNGWGRTDLLGLRDARLFSATTGSWTRAADMHRARYYPSLVTLPDGNVMSIGGVEKLVYGSSLAPGSRASTPAPQTIREDEIYDAASDTWTRIDTTRPSLPAFAHVHLLPNGKLLYAAAGMFYPPGGGDLEAGDWNFQRWFDPETQQ